MKKTCMILMMALLLFLPAHASAKRVYRLTFA